MSHNGKDTSGNSFKYSLIPLMLGVVLIFFLYRSCQNSVYDAQPQDGTATAVTTENEIEPERPMNVVAPVVETETAAPAEEAVAEDSLQAAE